MKTCTKCGETKQESEYYSAKDSWCKECKKELDRKRRMSDGYKDMMRAACKKYQHSERGKAKRSEQIKRYFAKNPERSSAKYAVKYAVKIGKLIPMPCEVCGGTERIHAHHWDYSEKLDVTWLCSTHHHILHETLARVGI